MAKRTRLGRAALLAALLLGAQAASAEIVARETVAGRHVTIERGRDGAFTLSIAGTAPVPLASAGEGGQARVQRVALQGGTEVLVVRIEGRDSAAVIAGNRTSAPAVLWRGSTAASGDPGERRWVDIVVGDVGNGVQQVVLGVRMESVRLCGLGMPLLGARAVDSTSATLRDVQIDPLAPALYAGSVPLQGRSIHAVPAPASAAPASVPTLNFVHRVTQGRVGPAPFALSDREPAAAWTPSARDVASATVTLAGFPVSHVLLRAPPAPATLPRTLTLLVGRDTRLDVTLPASVAPGARVAVPLVPARAFECLSIVATSAPPPGGSQAIAEVELAATFTLADLVQALDGAQGEEAAQLLGRAGAPGVHAVAQALASMSTAGARRAVRTVLADARTPESALALANALGQPEIAADARAALQRMGPVAFEALSTVVAIDPNVAALIASIPGPLDLKLRALAPVLGAERRVWHEARRSFVALLRQAVTQGLLEAWLASLPEDTNSVVRALSAAAEAAGDNAVARAQIAARARAVRSDTFVDRFRLLVPLAGDAEGRARVERVALEDPDDDLRAEAVRALASVGGAYVALVRALSDRIPRVRAEAVAGLHAHAPARRALVERLQRDAWPTVRAAAAEALAGDATNAGVLLAALDDPSVSAVRAVLAALRITPSPEIAPRLMSYAEDPSRNPDLRAEALAVLADRCERSVVDRLVHLASSQIDPALPPPEQAVGHSALAALAHIDPARARQLLARMEANAFAVAAVQRAMRNACSAR